jgi:acyl-CoA thioesterase-1
MEIRIAFIGDSFVLGTGDPAQLGWVGRVAASARERGHDVTAYNLGIRRDTSTDVAARWQGEAVRRLPSIHPRLLVFSFGVNDCIIEDGRARVPLDHMAINAATILREAKGFAPCLFVGPPPIAERTLNDRIRDASARLSLVCRDADNPFLDAFAPMLASPIWMDDVVAGDGAHPGAQGYAALAALVEAWPAWRKHLP